MSNNESQFHLNSKLIVKEWILEFEKKSKSDFLVVCEFPVTRDNTILKCIDEPGIGILRHTPEAWKPRKRSDIFEGSWHEIESVFDWSGVKWWQNSSPPSYKELMSKKSQVYAILDIALVSEYEFCVNIPLLNPRCKDDLTETEEVGIVLGGIEIEHTHANTSNKIKLFKKCPFPVLNLTTKEILINPTIGKNKVNIYLKNLFKELSELEQLSTVLFIEEIWKSLLAGKPD